METPKNHRRRTADAWRLMFDFLMKSAPRRVESLAKHGLTPNDSRALFTLEKGEGRPIGTLAREWGCDPSTATWLVDRLERAHLAERIPSTEDRRIKLVMLTPKGVTVKKELMKDFYLPPPEVAGLSRDDLDELIRLLQMLHSQRR
jgi:DNA-binding MarR family transcriptional regulator